VYILNIVGCYCGITTDPHSVRSPRNYQTHRMEAKILIFIAVIEIMEGMRGFVIEIPHIPTFLLEQQGFPFSKS